ncbi:MAG: HAD-IIIA family hydrolase [Bacteroidota bacterium]
MVNKLKDIKLFLTDVDGVLTDNGVYYGAEGEVLKRFSIRDGMAVERLLAMGVETGIITGEASPSVAKRAEKLKIKEVHLYVKDKATKFLEILAAKQLDASQVAYMGDDVNDLEIMQLVGIKACPNDAMKCIVDSCDYVCENKGGHGAFREFAEMIIASKELK